MKKPLRLHKLIYDLPSERYHRIPGTYSSSQFKDLLDDEEVFIKKYIHKTIPRDETDAFDIGNYFHTGVLEPEKVRQDCAVFPGRIRRGAKWESFLKKNNGKVILTPNMHEKALALIKAVHESPVAMSYIKKGRPEVSLFVKLGVYGGEIFSPKYGLRLDATYGWSKDPDITPILPRKGYVEIIVKVRADSLGPNFILDLKSTTGNARSKATIKEKIKYYNYDLSAALYLDVFNLVTKGAIKSFLWTFASKDYLTCKTWAATKDSIYVGRKKYMDAIFKFAACSESNFELYDSLGEIDVHYSDLGLLKPKETDLL